MQNNMEFNSLSALVSTMNRYYDITNLDSVSVTLIFISVITVLCMVYKLCVLLRKKWPVDEDLISTFDQNVSAGCCRERIKGYREKVPGDSLGYANIIDEIHFAASRLCQKFYEENCIALLNKYPEAVNCPKPPSMYTPFLRACWCGNPRPIEYMLRNGADVTMRTKKGDTPMFLAIYRVTKKPHAFDPECIDILYNADTDLLFIEVAISIYQSLMATLLFTWQPRLAMWILFAGFLYMVLIQTVSQSVTRKQWILPINVVTRKLFHC
ncbi:uncharacterized protein LOC111871245 isoform X2 [Cryptotermes secundus]|uniref:uncharacterized protein LOC111871245 isoform X2 n=1 Tax=Cryptotermes secundus TaxID=105785 RepID=UPI000CD7C481|nr:uncharacterized protein LOC111871245 isoform X2 [Cryptotermes secundus]